LSSRFPPARWPLSFRSLTTRRTTPATQIRAEMYGFEILHRLEIFFSQRMRLELRIYSP
jgi:hypothetical protein